MSDNDSNFPNPQGGNKVIHQGKWTPEEEAYVEGLIEEFKAGLLPLAEGTSLRTFLSQMLNCQPMRISKKFVGTNYNGKQLYVKKPYTMSLEEVRERRKVLCELERKFLAKTGPMRTAALHGSDVAPSSQMSGVDLPQTDSSASMSAFNKGGDAAITTSDLLNRALLQQPTTDSAALGGQATKSTSAFPVSEVAALSGFSSAEIAAELQKRTGGASGGAGSAGGGGGGPGFSSWLTDEAALKKGMNSENPLMNAALLNREQNSNTSVSDLLDAARKAQDAAARSAASSSSNFLTSAASTILHGSAPDNLLKIGGTGLGDTSKSDLMEVARNSFKSSNSTSKLAAGLSFGGATSANSLHNAASSSSDLGLGSVENNLDLLNQPLTSEALINASIQRESTNSLLDAVRKTSGIGSNLNYGSVSNILDAVYRNKDSNSFGNLEEPGSNALSRLLDKQSSMNLQNTMLNFGAGSSQSSTNLGDMAGNDILKKLGLGQQSEFGSSSNMQRDGSAAGSSRMRNLELSQLFNPGDELRIRENHQQIQRQLSQQQLEKEALMQQLGVSSTPGDNANAAINEYLALQQQFTPNAGGLSSVSAAVPMRTEQEALMTLKRRYLSERSEQSDDMKVKRFRSSD